MCEIKPVRQTSTGYGAHSPIALEKSLMVDLWPWVYSMMKLKYAHISNEILGFISFMSNLYCETLYW